MRFDSISIEFIRIERKTIEFQQVKKKQKQKNKKEHKHIKALYCTSTVKLLNFN